MKSEVRTTSAVLGELRHREERKQEQREGVRVGWLGDKFKVEDKDMDMDMSGEPVEIVG
jgi:hypothetical protein